MTSIRSWSSCVVLVAGTALMLSACSDSPTGSSSSYLNQFDEFWSTFDREYSYFEYKRINWDSLRAVFRPRASAASTQTELVGSLKEMVAPLRDLHVTFRTPTGAQEPTYTPSHGVNWDQTVWTRFTLECRLHQVKPNLGYCSMGTIPYVVVGGWNSTQFGTADLDFVVDRFRDAPGMIIDVRPNRGGSDALAFTLAGRFATQRTVLGYVRYRNGPRHDDFTAETARSIEPRGTFQFTRPVVVLSGRAVYSSNESFIAAMRELPNVTIIGDTTGGATGNPGEHALGGGWRYTVSRWIEWTADRRLIEWNGIPPDVFVPWDQTAVQAGRDPVLEAALARLQSATGVR